MPYLNVARVQAGAHYTGIRMPMLAFPRHLPGRSAPLVRPRETGARSAEPLAGGLQAGQQRFQGVAKLRTQLSAAALDAISDGALWLPSGRMRHSLPAAQNTSSRLSGVHASAG